MSSRLKDKVALVTGASRGIGKAISLLFAEEGADVVINYLRRDDEAQKVISEIKAMGRQTSMMKANTANRKEVEMMVQRIIKEYGRIDVLVNNAGIVHKGDLFTLKDDEFDEMVKVNVGGILNCCRAVAGQMVNRKYGKIINISSMAGRGSVSLGITHYAITKGAVNTLTKRLSLELGPHGVNVNAIAPGLIKTDMTTENLPSDEAMKMIKSYSEKNVLRRVGEPNEIAKVALFLAADESSFIAGQTITVDGGRVDFLSGSP